MTTMLQPGKGKKILFANFPADGHFNPLTGLAVQLAAQGYDVRWYCSEHTAPKLKKLQLHHYPFKKAIDVSEGNFDEIFPGRQQKKTTLSRLKFDIINAFILRAPEYYADIKEIYQSFPFDIMIADCAFTGIPFVRDLMYIPVISIGVFPLTESSADLPPNGLGIEPSYTFWGKIRQSLLRTVANTFIFREPNAVLHQLLDQYNIPHRNENAFDLLVNKSDFLLQSGTPGFEYKRSDMSSHIRFAGPLLPHSNCSNSTLWFDERLNRYKNIILVTQGTVEKNVKKILVPALEAFKGTDTLVVATTGGSHTMDLKNRYSRYENIIIEDFIPFAEVMPYADVYITNGGYGGVMLGIQNQLPMVVAGINEGKNEICARVNYFKIGINLRTETPQPGQVKEAVEKILANTQYSANVKKLAEEFSMYDSNTICANTVTELLQRRVAVKQKVHYSRQAIVRKMVQ